jgi:hypothetical protein
MRRIALPGAAFVCGLVVVAASLTAMVWADEADILVRLTHGPTCGGGPAYDVTVFRDGRVRWEGHWAVAVRGLAEGRLDAEQIYWLNEAFRLGGFFEMDEFGRLPGDTTEVSCRGSRTFLVFKFGERAKRVVNRHCRSREPTAIAELEWRVGEIIGTSRWIASSDAPRAGSSGAPPSR